MDMADKPGASQPEKPPSLRIVGISSMVYALRFLAMAAYYPYVFLWLESNGFDTHERGLLGAINGVTRTLAPTALGALADWTGRRKLIFVSGSLINAVAIAALPLVPRSLVAQAALLVVGSLSEQSSLVDAFVQRSLAWAGLAGSQPTARAFGALTWAASAPIFGELVQLFGLPFLFRLYGVLVACVAMPIVLALPISAAYAHTDRHHTGDTGGTGDADEAPPEVAASSATTAAAATVAAPPLSFTRRLRAALCGEGAASRRLRFCMLLITMVGFQMGIGFAFGFIYLKNELHAPGVVVGLSLTFQAAIEVPLFRVANWLIRSLGGVRPALLSTSLAGAIRWFGWWAATTPLAPLPFEAGHGWSFALAFTCISLVADDFAASGLQATVVGILNSALSFGNIGATVGWGVVVEAVGLRDSFGVAALVFAVASLPLLAYAPVCVAGAARAALQCAAGSRRWWGRRRQKDAARLVDAQRAVDLAAWRSPAGAEAGRAA